MRNLLVFAFVLVTMGSVALSVLHREFAMPQGDCAYLETIRIDSAEDDAKDAIEAKDFHLLSVGSASPVIPGLPDQSAKDRFAVKPIPCSGDTYASPWHERLIKDSRIYAEHYNAAILHALEEEQATK